MKGSESNVWKFMVGINQYCVPCYQRNYSWGEKNCRELYDDMINLHEQIKYNDDASHFIGSVVYKKVEGTQSSILIIDGQQRLTTMYLFYLALYRVAKERLLQGDSDCSFAEKVNVRILEIDDSVIDSVYPHRFILSSKRDQEAIDKIFAGNDGDYVDDSLITKSYRYFYQCLTNENRLSLKEFYSLTQSVSLIDISLDHGDDAQLIFESLNSKGVDLTVSDKVRNFVLMDFSQKEANHYYSDLWVPIEQNCSVGSIDVFLRYYLSIKLGQPPKKDQLYAEFKSYFYAHKFTNLSMMEDLLMYSELYVLNKSRSYKLYPQRDTDLNERERASLLNKINQCLYRLDAYIEYDVRIPFIMHCMWLHKEGQITGTELLTALQMIESFLFRRWACSVAPNSLSKLFASFPRRIAEHEGSDFITKLSEILCSGGSRLPNDEAFKQAIETENFFIPQMLTYIIERLESYESKEQCKIYGEKLTCEHIMPQTLTDEWRAELGSDADAIHEEWQHRLANLTLTAYNSEYSNRPFAEKCTMEHGLASSPLHTNRAIASHEHWGLAELQQRAKELGEKACKIWPYPKHSD